MTFIKRVGIYTVANVVNAAIPFLLLPFLTNHLSPVEYGIVAMFQVLFNGFTPFISLGNTASISREYFEQDKIDFSAYVTNAIYLTLSSSVVVMILAVLLQDQIYSLTEFPASWLWTVVLFTLVSAISEIILALWRVQNKAGLYGVFRIARTALDMGLSLYFVIMLSRSWQGRIEGQLLATLLFSFLALFFLYKGKFLKFKWNRTYINKLLSFGIPLIPHILGGVIITYSDRIFITKMVGLDEMGIYAVGYQIGMVISMVQNSFNQAWQPWLFEKLKSDDSQNKSKVVRLTYYYFLGLLLLVGLLVLVSPLIMKVFIGAEFQGAIVYIFWIALGFAFNGMYKMVSNYLFYLRKTVILGVLTFLTALINIGLNYVLILKNGSVGAAQSTAISFLIQFIIVWYVSAKYFKLPWLGKLKSTN